MRLKFKNGLELLLWVITVCFLVCSVIGCSVTAQKYYYLNETYDKNGNLLSREMSKSSSKHKNKFSDKSLDSVKSEVSMREVKVEATKYTSIVNPESIEKTGNAIGDVSGKITEGAVRGAKKL